MSFFFIISFVLLKPRRERHDDEDDAFFVAMSSKAISTRAQKRRMGERDSLWDLIVKCDDICFTHILPRLNRTDLKFLYGGEYGDEKVD